LAFLLGLVSDRDFGLDFGFCLVFARHDVSEVGETLTLEEFAVTDEVVLTQLFARVAVFVEVIDDFRLAFHNEVEPVCVGRDRLLPDVATSCVWVLTHRVFGFREILPAVSVIYALVDE